MLAPNVQLVHYAGYDPGSGYGTLVLTTVVLEHGRIIEQHRPVKLTLPSLIGTANVATFTNDRATTTTTTLAEVLRPGEIALGYHRKDYFIGPLAESEGINTTSAKGALKRYTDLHSRLLLLALYGALVSQPESEVRLVTGVPMSLFDKETRAAVKRNLQGTHPFVWNGQPRSVTVKVGTVTREGIKSLALYGSAKARQGVIDIGERTCDIGQTEGQTPINRLCKAETFGVGKVLDALIGEIKSRYHRSVRLSEARAMLKALTDDRPLPVMKVGNVPLAEEELLSILEAAKASEWNGMETFIDATWNEEGSTVGSNLELVLCIGGGAKVWQRELRAKFPQAIFPQASELFPGDEEDAALIANAEAYHHLAFDLQEIEPQLWNG